MKSDDYKDMKSRLRKVLQQWGLWTDDELEEVARFVEQEAASGPSHTIRKMAPLKEGSKKVPLALNERLVAESSRLADEIFRNPTDHDRAAALRLVLAGAEVALAYVKESGLVGPPTPARGG